MAAPVLTQSPKLSTYPYNPPYSGFWRRYSAALVDGLILGIASIIPGFIVGLTLGMVQATLPEDVRLAVKGLNTLIGLVIGIVESLAYYAYFDTQKGGVTLGRKALGLALITETGEPITLKQSLIRTGVRYIAALLLCLGFLTQLFTEKRQTIHDMVTHTLVVRTREQATWVPCAINGTYFGLIVVGLIAIIGVVALGIAAVGSGGLLPH